MLRVPVDRNTLPHAGSVATPRCAPRSQYWLAVLALSIIYAIDKNSEDVPPAWLPATGVAPGRDTRGMSAESDT
jgi:hypothetical protein